MLAMPEPKVGSLDVPIVAWLLPFSATARSSASVSLMACSIASSISSSSSSFITTSPASISSKASSPGIDTSRDGDLVLDGGGAAEGSTCSTLTAAGL